MQPRSFLPWTVPPRPFVPVPPSPPKGVGRADGWNGRDSPVPDGSGQVADGWTGRGAAHCPGRVRDGRTGGGSRPGEA